MKWFNRHNKKGESDGSLWSYSRSGRGYLGDGKPGDEDRPRETLVKVADDVAYVTVEAAQTLFIKTDGTLWGFGTVDIDWFLPGTTEYLSPVKILDNVKDVSIGKKLYIVRTDGTLVRQDQLRQTYVELMKDVKSVYRQKGRYTLAIKNDNSLWAWGLNSNGELGDGTTTDRAETNPVKVLDNVVSVSIPHENVGHNLAIKEDGSLWSWGYNIGGVVGNGKRTTFKSEYDTLDVLENNNQLTPVKVMDNVVAAQAAKNRSFAVKSDGTLWGWGHMLRDNYHNLDVSGDNKYKLTPVQLFDGVKVVGGASAPTKPEPPKSEVETIPAVSNASQVFMNGKQIQFNAYTINSNNYIKLRDIAFALMNTDKPFEVTWDGANNAISLVSGKSYTAVGGEMEGNAKSETQATAANSKILLNGKELNLNAYVIDESNYFKLRDIGKALNFNVTWDSANNAILINTAEPYNE